MQTGEMEGGGRAEAQRDEWAGGGRRAGERVKVLKGEGEAGME